MDRNEIFKLSKINQQKSSVADNPVSLLLLYTDKINILRFLPFLDKELHL